MIVKPASGALVRDPLTKLAIEAGTEVDETDPYFARAVADGDLKPDTTKPARRGAQSEDAA